LEAEGKVKTLDVRPYFERGTEPFAAIMRAADQLPVGSALKLLVPFEPLPLYGVLAAKGFSRWRAAPEDPSGTWEVYFFRENEDGDEIDPDGPVPSCENLAGSKRTIEGEGDGELIDIDVRGLEAPEPLERVLAILEDLSYGTVLRVRHHREPLILFDILTERGFAYRSRELDESDWEVRIWQRR